MFRYSSFILYILLFIFLVGCSNKNAVKNTGIAFSNQQISKEIENLKNSQDYLIQPGDLVEIKVYKEDDMDRTLRVTTNGSITFPLIGNIKISGLTVSDAEQKLENALQAYLKAPSVSFLIKEYANKTVYVLGQVKKPSSISILPEKTMTLLEAITSAGGFTDVAAISKVKILRMEDSVQKSIEVDVSQITKEGNKQFDVPLKPADVIFVPQSLF
ncbi:MAG: polysaccharide biosynthesis/export family protein [Elusimicrobiaceae bacterium]|nr:polysaccharide biosynthesis/export family protein [Elusimicrobiaceae bacterium]